MCVEKHDSYTQRSTCNTGPFMFSPDHLCMSIIGPGGPVMHAQVVRPGHLWQHKWSGRTVMSRPLVHWQNPLLLSQFPVFQFPWIILSVSLGHRSTHPLALLSLLQLTPMRQNFPKGQFRWTWPCGWDVVSLKRTTNTNDSRLVEEAGILISTTVGLQHTVTKLNSHLLPRI